MFLSMRPLARFPFNELRNELDRVFDAFGSRELNGFGGRPMPALNIWEDGENLYAEAEVPGLRMEDLEILVMGNELTLKGRTQAGNGEGRVYHRQERLAGEFSRTLTLPVEIDADKVEATLRDGILTIRLPKAAAAKARKITVKSV